MSLQPGNYVLGNPERGGDRFLEQQSAINRPSGIYTTSIPPQNREFQERSEVIQRGGQQASGYYHKSIRNEDVRCSDFDVVAEETFASSSNRIGQSTRNGNPELEGGQFLVQRPRPNRPSGVYSTSLPQLNREFTERSEVIQRGGQQASGYYHKSIRNEDIGRSYFDVVAEETFASSPNITGSQRYPQEQSVTEATHSRHPIQRGKTQASGSFQRTIHNDDANLSDPVTSAQLERPPLNSNDPAPVSSQIPFTNQRIFQSNEEPQRGQTTNNYYWNFQGDADDVQQISRRDRQGHMTNSGQAPTQPTWTTIPEADRLTSSKVLDRVFEWEPTTEGQTSTYTNIPILSQERQDGEAPEALYQNQNPEVLLQPRTLLPRPVVSASQNASANDQLNPNQASRQDGIQANPYHDYFNSNAIANGGYLDPQPEAPAPGQTSASVPPAPFHQNTPAFRFDRLKERAKSRRTVNIILTIVAVLCFLLAGVVVVILVVVV